MYNSKKKQWYVLQSFSGFESKVAQSIRDFIKNNKLGKIFGNVMVPTEEVIEIRGGQKRKSEHKFFPGYILLQMIMNNTNWHLIKSIPKVLGFVGGSSDKPVPISEKEINMIINKLKEIGDKPRPKTIFEPGETVRVNHGPFSDFNGIVEHVDYEKNRLTVSVSIFGRATPVELNFSQIEKN